MRIQNKAQREYSSLSQFQRDKKWQHLSGWHQWRRGLGLTYCSYDNLYSRTHTCNKITLTCEQDGTILKPLPLVWTLPNQNKIINYFLAEYYDIRHGGADPDPICFTLSSKLSLMKPEEPHHLGKAEIKPWGHHATTPQCGGVVSDAVHDKH